jgi:tRNA A-37 threonylcarbamoyl transferase component Bud32
MTSFPELSPPPHFDPGPRVRAGALGDVYVVRNQLTKREYDLTVLSSDLARDGGLLRRLRSEARAVMQLHHAGIATVFDCALLPSGAPYLLSEHVPWQPLSTLLRNRIDPPPLMPALQLLLQMAEALEFAHEHRVVHRDLRPERILVAPDLGRCKLTDFGLAKIVDPTYLEQTRLTRDTIEYTSPEEIDRRPIDHRSDVYALGCIAYRMLTGTAPYHSPDPMRVIESHLEGRPPPMRLSGCEPAAAAAIEQVFRRCLYRAPADRFGSAETLALAIQDAIERVAAGRSGARVQMTPAADVSWTPRRTGVTTREALLEGLAQELVDSGQATLSLGRVLVGVIGKRHQLERLDQEEARLRERLRELDYDARAFEVKARLAIANLRQSARLAVDGQQSDELRAESDHEERSIARTYADAARETASGRQRLEHIEAERTDAEEAWALCTELLAHELEIVLKTVREPSPELQRLLNGLSPEQRGIVANEVAVEKTGPNRM